MPQESNGGAGAERVPELYSNTVQLEATAYDIGISFGLLSDGVDRRDLTVRMSPQHAKSLAILLDRFLAAYEREIGQVNLPDSLVARLRGEESDGTREP